VIDLEFTPVAAMVARNATLFASVAALTMGSAAYAYCIISAPRPRAQFSLGRLEEFELERAVLLYQKVNDRLQDIRDEERQTQQGLRARYQHRKRVRRIKKFAGTDPNRLIHQMPPSTAETRDQPLEAVPNIPDETAWFSILGVSRSATIDEVKQAYKMKIKQNHPDRVQEMSPSFQELAEAETKKLNAAYQEALLSLQSV